MREDHTRVFLFSVRACAASPVPQRRRTGRASAAAKRGRAGHASPVPWRAAQCGRSKLSRRDGALERFNGKQPANRGVTTVDVLTQAGAQGWELVSTDIHPNGAGVLEEYWLKRPVQ